MAIYTKRRRDEMTFGFWAEGIPANIVPSLAGSVRLASMADMYDQSLIMDRFFVGMRRSTIDDWSGKIRQAVLYTMVTKVVKKELKIAVYSRSAGSDERMLDDWSIGFGGHVEDVDLVYHVDHITGEIANGCVSSFETILSSGRRELSEEVTILGRDEKDVSGLSDIYTLGYISDFQKDCPNHVGNTHFGFLGFVRVGPFAEIEMNEDKQKFIGWFTRRELMEHYDRFEVWSKMVISMPEDVLIAQMEENRKGNYVRP